MRIRNVIVKRTYKFCSHLVFIDWFNASGNSLLLHSASLDYETAPVMNITVSATDNGLPPKSLQVCLNNLILLDN